ncbi:MAG: lipid II flippase MurJ, partial [Thermodesulfobacteriota bacterium]|nr:lipid II flippase MurJ [Thermodesulfobacteriota bacterium]
AIFGAAVYQMNVIVGRFLASLLPEGSVSYLYYADRLVQFPLGVFAMAMATAVLPSLSRQAAAQDMDGLRASYAYALKLVFFISIPAMTGLIVLRDPIVKLLFERGAFDQVTTQRTAEALVYYALGLWAVSGTRIVIAAFYALQDTKTPVKIAVVSLLANMVLSVVLMGPLGHGGLALATSLASAVNLMLLTRALRKRLGGINGRDIVRSVLRSCLSSAVMGGAIVAAALWAMPAGEAAPWYLLAWVLGSVAGGAILYAGCAWLFRCPELGALIDVMGTTVRRPHA